MICRINNVFIKTLLIFSVINFYSNSTLAEPFADLILAEGKVEGDLPAMSKDVIVKLAQQRAMEKIDAKTYSQVSDWRGYVGCNPGQDDSCIVAQQIAAFVPTVALPWDWHIKLGADGSTDSIALEIAEQSAKFYCKNRKTTLLSYTTYPPHFYSGGGVEATFLCEIIKYMTNASLVNNFNRYDLFLDREQTIKRYVVDLNNADVKDILNLFIDEGFVISDSGGKKKANEFYTAFLPKLAFSSAELHQIFVGTSDQNRSAARFKFDFREIGSSKISAGEYMDEFIFAENSAKLSAVYMFENLGFHE